MMRKISAKREISEALQKMDKRLSQTLFAGNAEIWSDGGLVEVKGDNGKWNVALVSEAKHQRKDAENIKVGKLLGKNNDKDIRKLGMQELRNISKMAILCHLGGIFIPYAPFFQFLNAECHNH